MFRMNIYTYSFVCTYMYMCIHVYIHIENNELSVVFEMMSREDSKANCFLCHFNYVLNLRLIQMLHH